MGVVKKIWILSKNILVKILSERFKKIFENKNPRTKLVSYFVGCYPTPDQSFELIKEAIDNGVSILEIGYCTSEASAEGPVIKAAHDHVLKSGYSLNDTIKLVDKIRSYNKDVGILLMGYIANLYKYPIKQFVDDIKKAGADAVLVVDAPHELKEENELRDALNDNGLSLIKLAAPTTDQKRLEDIIKISSGFIYQVNVSGVTGVKSANETDVANFVKRIKKLTNIPVLLWKIGHEGNINVDSIEYYNEHFSVTYSEKARSRMNYLDAIDALIIEQATKAPKAYLDIGCGDGRRTRKISQSIKAKKTVGIDNSEKMLSFVERNLD